MHEIADIALAECQLGDTAIISRDPYGGLGGVNVMHEIARQAQAAVAPS